MNSSPTRSHGFTLIEVLAALVIVALGMLGVIEAVTQAARNGTYLRDKTLAHWIGMNIVTERRLQGSPPDLTETSGDLDYAGQRWHWTLRVTQTQVESMRRMDVSVRAAAGKDGTSIAAATGFFGEAIGPAGGPTLAWAGSGAPGSGKDNDGDTGEDANNNGNGNGNGDNTNDNAGDGGDDTPQANPVPAEPAPSDDEE